MRKVNLKSFRRMKDDDSSQYHITRLFIRPVFGAHVQTLEEGTVKETVTCITRFHFGLGLCILQDLTKQYNYLLDTF